MPTCESPRLIRSIIVALIGVAGVTACRPTPTDTAPPPQTPPTPAPAGARSLPDVEQTGAIEITANVRNARIVVDGQLQGTAPKRITGLTPGPHEVRLEADGHEPWEGSVTILPDVAIPLEARLLTSPARLRVECDVPGATVFLDRKYVGTAPVDVDDLTPGPYTLSVSADGYDIHTKTVRLDPGRSTQRVSLKAVRLDEALDVVHRHGIGSCRGHLTASADGIAFASTNADHSFQASLDDIREIKAEYLNKNLLLRLRDGRKLNFTTADENADALVTFEQNVAKARRMSLE